MTKLAAALVVLLLLVAPARAQPDCASEADRLRAHLVEAKVSTRRWNLAWSIAFGAAAAGQLALAMTRTNPFGEFTSAYQDTLYVGAAKATVGLASRLVLPLGTSVPPPEADRCAELTALRATVARLAIKERRLFWLTHIGGTALNLAGALVLWRRQSAGVGGVSFLISYPVGPVSAYTMPRKSWHLWREEGAGWSFAIVPHPEQTTISIGRTF